ncbi:hypothetical protein OHS33_16340 [Streptomyces sp. NBC_00536]|uniref:hypothetical protein n=1 Tax=Streptomyces sp. NBC_00536 TaxID=2975769 RepID=UPI002E808B37|nr:hypothetical protein [Streptomyces sp. NBC_00536]WUC83758.1 hypothetical protein OHS33_16340 [Streptomyces sp. NBC_00536]
MAFSAAELHVLRRSLAHALQSSTAPLTAADVQDCLRLAQSVDEAVSEAGRLRDFLAADLSRYREALPGSLPGYLELLRDALAAGYEPVPDDLAALRALRGNPAAAALLERASRVAERSVRRRLAAPRTRLRALAGGKEEEPPARPSPPEHPGEHDGTGGAERPVPKPSEVFPPRRAPVPPPASRRAVS